MSFEKVYEFEKIIAKFFNSKYAVSTDCCTHSIELCLRLKSYNNIMIPKKTYIGIPMVLEKLGLSWSWRNEDWENYYYIYNTNIIDAAVYWKKNSYINGSLMCLSFQFQKHINIGRGGMILTDNEDDYIKLVKMSYDGRERNTPWRQQNINSLGFHYYMTPENAEKGIKIFLEKANQQPKKWTSEDYPDLSLMEIFKSLDK